MGKIKSDCAPETPDNSDDCTDSPITAQVYMGTGARMTCAKEQMIRRVSLKGFTEEQCLKACEVQYKTWKATDDVGQCKFFGLSNLGMCILYEDCSSTRRSRTPWITWKMSP